MLRFMKNKILIPLLIIGALAAFFSFKYRIKAKQSSEERRTIVIETVVKTIEAAHFSPRPINDSFSARVYQKILTEMDYDKLFFTAKEVNVLKTYQYKIDDQIRMGSIEFFDSLDAMYIRCMNISEKYYQEILTEPFSFKAKEEINLNAEKEDYAKNEDALKDRWYSRLKYRVLVKYVDLKTEQDKKKENKDSVNAKYKTDTELEAQAREDVKKKLSTLV